MFFGLIKLSSLWFTYATLLNLYELKKDKSQFFWTVYFHGSIGSQYFFGSLILAVPVFFECAYLGALL